MNSFADELKKGCIEFEVITVISSRNHDYLWYYIGEFDDIMLISDLMRWLRVDLFFERSKRFIRWFIRLLPLRKINEELWFFTFLLSFVSNQPGRDSRTQTGQFRTGKPGPNHHLKKMDRLCVLVFCTGFLVLFRDESYTETPAQNNV